MTICKNGFYFTICRYYLDKQVVKIIPTNLTWYDLIDNGQEHEYPQYEHHPVDMTLEEIVESITL